MPGQISRIQIRRDSFSNWETFNPVLAEGELAYDTTNLVLRVGDGSTQFLSLPGMQAAQFLSLPAMQAAEIGEGETGAGVPVGAIIMYSGDAGSLSEGWALCDGDNGTPDLRDRFIVGAGNNYSVGDTGGADSVSLTTAQLPSHSHTSGTLSAASNGAHTHGAGSYELDTNPNNSDPNWGHTLHAHNIGAKWVSTTSNNTYASGPTVHGVDGVIKGTSASAGAHTHSVSGSTGSSGSGNAHENRPPYYALAYIMRIS